MRPHILVLPGMALNASIFPPFAAASLAAEFVAGGFDTMEGYVGAVDRLTTTPAWRDAPRRIVIGHSFGGMLALAWLLAHGGTGSPAIDGLVLCNTTAGPMFDRARLRLGPVRVPVGPLMPLWNSRAVTAALQGTLGRRPGAVDFQRYRHRSELAIGLAGWRHTTVAARRGYRFAMRGFDVRDRLGEITVPTVVLHSPRDTYFAPGAAEELVRGLPRARLELVPDARHLIPLTHPEVVQRAVRNLLHGAMR
jgi:pimeloyl-ACP methyl ester carboxylesterase